jgi:hypothetical protein
MTGDGLLATFDGPARAVAYAAAIGREVRWARWTGLIASLLYLTSQGDILATAIPGFPVWDLGGLRGPIRRPWATPSPRQPQRHHEQTQYEHHPAGASDRAADRSTQGGVVNEHRSRPYGARLGHEGGTTCGCCS